ncbi:murein hydrolase activator EnvC [Porphyrobacter sp. GA68]|uniref:murein hydrolase activator EnvC family protein n=1 Tax=Porphyrobacter sp. GA68 TaxID=2883480 RepID=UPI001D18EB32|nr:peptidoglycan DD-metalloendopeptidase family protein [Porphyrobacter sp. GA68]
MAVITLLVLAVGSLLLLRPSPEFPGDDELAPAEVQSALAAAQQAARAAAAQSEQLEAQAASAGAAQERAELRLAVLAAQLQEAEAQASLGEARVAALERQRERTLRRLAAEREPLARLSAGLQHMALRPPVLAALQPGSVRQTVYLRAVLTQAAPAIARRTDGVQQALRRNDELATRQRQQMAILKRDLAEIAAKREEVRVAVARYTAQHSRVSVLAKQQAQRAADLMLRTRDLGEVARELDREATLRAQLAALPGPVMRPASAAGTPSAAQRESASAASRQPASQPFNLRLPVVGQVTGGFGEQDASGLPRTGLTMRVRPGALVIAPLTGRVVFAGPFDGYGRVVIFEHADGSTVLLTGLAALDVAAGQSVVVGTPVGTAGQQRPEIAMELRRQGRPTNPLPLILNARD